MDNLYEELDLTPNCSFEEIKQQYRILARIHHPDMGGDAEKFKKIKLAYEVLSDSERRTEYDRTGSFQPAMDIHVQARETLSQIVFSVLPNFDPNNQNIIEIIRNEIHSGIKTLASNKNDCNVYIEKLELTRSKINLNDNSMDNLFYSFVDVQIQNKHSDLNHIDKKILIAKEMLRILDNYSYGFTELPNVVSGGGFSYIPL